jgi:hypothetical protein
VRQAHPLVQVDKWQQGFDTVRTIDQLIDHPVSGFLNERGSRLLLVRLCLPASALQEIPEGNPSRAGSLAGQAAQAKGHRIRKTVRDIHVPLADRAHKRQPAAWGGFFLLIQAVSWAGSQAQSTAHTVDQLFVTWRIHRVEISGRERMGFR